jgi:hypothetical protein
MPAAKLCAAGGDATSPGVVLHEKGRAAAGLAAVLVAAMLPAGGGASDGAAASRSRHAGVAARSRVRDGEGGELFFHDGCVFFRAVVLTQI